MKQTITIKGAYQIAVNPFTGDTLYKSKFFEGYTKEEVEEYEIVLPAKIQRKLVKIMSSNENFDWIEDIDDIYCEIDFYDDNYEYQIFKVEEEEKIIEIDADYFSIQSWVDGFGNDTCVDACFSTYEEAKEYVEGNDALKIVPQTWGNFKNRF